MKITDALISEIQDLQTAYIFLNAHIKKHKQSGYTLAGLYVMEDVLICESKLIEVEMKLGSILEQIDLKELMRIFTNKKLMQEKHKITYDRQKEISMKYIGRAEIIENVI